jgi:hypothetical protein
VVAWLHQTVTFRLQILDGVVVFRLRYFAGGCAMASAHQMIQLLVAAGGFENKRSEAK